MKAYRLRFDAVGVGDSIHDAFAKVLDHIGEGNPDYVLRGEVVFNELEGDEEAVAIFRYLAHLGELTIKGDA